MLKIAVLAIRVFEKPKAGLCPADLIFQVTRYVKNNAVLFLGFIYARFFTYLR